MCGESENEEAYRGGARKSEERDKSVTRHVPLTDARADASIAITHKGRSSRRGKRLLWCRYSERRRSTTIRPAHDRPNNDTATSRLAQAPQTTLQPPTYFFIFVVHPATLEYFPSSEPTSLTGSQASTTA